MKLKPLLITTIGAFAIAGANAGDYAPEAKAPIYEEPAGWYGEVSAGYDNRYIFRGLWFADDTVWGGLSISNEIAPGLTWSTNVWYIDAMSNALNYSEANVGTGLEYETAVGTFSAGFLYYQFQDGFAGNSAPSNTPAGQRDATEFNIGYSRELFMGITGSVMAAYDLRIDAQYYEAGLSKSWALTDTIGMDLSGALGYGANNYYSRLGGDLGRNAFTHGLVTLAFPVALKENVTLTPHLSGNFSGPGRDGSNAGTIGDNAFFYGVSVAVGF
ncbi:hypothetical protein N9B21_01915 [Verrucomicrobiales bacterium]|jgi:hypothetical protein|nr:hypothetical protein [Verrucomicrobiales bacterium]MDA7926772.1 hypothetical protein [Verrucomicrobiales bacterium]